MKAKKDATGVRTIAYAIGTDIGNREVNQDNLMMDLAVPYVREDCTMNGTFDSDASTLHLVLVADGVTGSCYSELAAREVMSVAGAFLEENRTIKKSPQQAVTVSQQTDATPQQTDVASQQTVTTTVALEKLADQLLDQLNEKVIELGASIGKTASTVVMLMWRGDEYLVAAIGDSSIYLLRQNELKKLTYAQVLSKNILHNYLGKKKESGSRMAYVMPGRLDRGDVFCLCSDGITECLTESQIKNALRHKSGKDIKKMWKYLHKKTGRDNATAVIIHM